MELTTLKRLVGTDSTTNTDKEKNMAQVIYDIICENESEILFVEVKTRTDAEFSLRYGRPAAAVTKKKLENMTLCARQYLYETKCPKKPRIDVIEVYIKEEDGAFVLSEKGIVHIKNVTG